MRRLLTVLALAGGLMAPLALQAQTPPAHEVFTPAPVPNADDEALSGHQRGVTPALRAGGPFDAGPMNATPFSGEMSTVLTGTEAARALRQSQPGVDPTPSANGE